MGSLESRLVVRRQGEPLHLVAGDDQPQVGSLTRGACGRVGRVEVKPGYHAADWCPSCLRASAVTSGDAA